jgi:hypothetical protein
MPANSRWNLIWRLKGYSIVAMLLFKQRIFVVFIDFCRTVMLCNGAYYHTSSSSFPSSTFSSMLRYFTIHCSLRLIVRSELDVPTFATRRLHACHHARAPSGGRWNCGREMSREFCLNAYLHATFTDFFYMP